MFTREAPRGFEAKGKNDGGGQGRDKSPLIGGTDRRGAFRHIEPAEIQSDNVQAPPVKAVANRLLNTELTTSQAKPSRPDISIPSKGSAFRDFNAVEVQSDNLAKIDQKLKDLREKLKRATIEKEMADAEVEAAAAKLAAFNARVAARKAMEAAAAMEEGGAPRVQRRPSPSAEQPQATSPMFTGASHLL